MIILKSLICGSFDKFPQYHESVTTKNSTQMLFFILMGFGANESHKTTTISKMWVQKWIFSVGFYNTIIFIDSLNIK